MLHFGLREAPGHPLVWGARVVEGESDFESDINTISGQRPQPMPGQRLGGIGFFRNETGQPRFNDVSGAYTFDTYLTTYSFANGQYSFALEVHITLTEGLGLSDSVSVNAIRILTLSEGLGLADSATSTRIVPLTLTESLSLTDTITASGIYGLVLSESLLLQDTVGDNGALVAYVVNSNTGAMTTYNNFNFNSFAQLDGKFYGMTSDGLFEVTGDTDSGVAIDARIDFGTTDLQTPEVSGEVLKRLSSVYFGVNTVGDMMLKVTANGLDNLYTLSASTATSLHTGRLLLGKGVAARYWDFELTNTNGGDFTLESISFHPVALTRRIVRG